MLWGVLNVYWYVCVSVSVREGESQNERENHLCVSLQGFLLL